MDINRIYEKIKTPYKYGAVVKFDDYLADSPTVFKYNDRWYMYYVRIDKDCGSGYETHFSSSDNLVDWKYEGVILNRGEGGGWDSKQCGGYAVFPDIEFGGTNELAEINGNYYIGYIGGCKDGYEPDPLLARMAYSPTPDKQNSFIKFKEPVLSPSDSDAREFETVTIFKSYMFEDKKRTLGHKYVNAYNARAYDTNERIYLAVSDDGTNWKRYGDKPIINEVGEIPGLRISGDPQIVLIDDIYVMFYFRLENGKAYNTFACSTDLVNWERWTGEPLIECEYECENVYAHKNYVLMRNGIVYHFYCAVNDKNERFIALATSEKIK